jgi:hypothetical protein
MSNITNKPIKPNAVDMSNIKYSKVNSLPSGAKTLYLNHGDGVAPLFIQTPEMTIPFDSGTYYPDNEESGKYAIQVSMDNMDTNPQMKEFHDMLMLMDEKILKDCIDNSQEWFKKKNPNHDVMKELYTPMVKISKDSETGEPTGKWAPKFNFKIVKRNNKVLCDVYDTDKQAMNTSGEDAVDLETMFKKGSKVKMILKCNGLWIASGKFGCTWRAEQIKIDTPTGFSGYAMLDDEADDGCVELSRQSTKVVDNYVEDESESEGEEETTTVKRLVKKA